MPRLTITLSDERHRALKEAAARQGRSIRQLIEESLDFYGIKTMENASSLVSKARKRSGLDEISALELAVEETRAERQR
ncbi:MAG: CopG family transcriptional regulator [Deltaproteobacteria bacterium]|nr:MAG: CopG family transcriptional regulator [Deltaproteobacteria bacterium]